MTNRRKKDIVKPSKERKREEKQKRVSGNKNIRTQGLISIQQAYRDAAEMGKRDDLKTEKLHNRGGYIVKLTIPQ